MAKDKWLKKGTMKCPNENKPLHWEVFGGMRVVKEQDGIRLYQAKCPECGYYWGVRA